MKKRGRGEKEQKNVILFLFIGGLIVLASYPSIGLVLIAFAILISVQKQKGRYSAHKKLLLSSIKVIDAMDGIEFENYLASLFSSLGYKLQRTPASGDFGADLILKKDGRSIAVQAKRYNKSVGVAAVQQVSASIHYYKCTEAWVVTNNTFTKSAYELAKKSNVTLIDRNKLVNLIIKDQKVVSIL